ncbi:LEA type 2 family protein [Geopsychrobacter electrodiphilus]|uniref:LEA type 2 family protein n=1 Tax=Geopsychrobacter electrodiphilus TaxID=225196 RepID=UPI00037C97BC|nr:LEA type 2 family protein [Geopsychrobacter electrodiphilus]
MRQSIRSAIYLILLFLATGCAALTPGLESPQVSLTSFRLLPSQSMAPRFEIGLHVINPNLIPLPLKGVVYQISIEGHKLLTGVTNDLPTIQGYGEGDILLQATTDLLNGLRLLSTLMSEPRDRLHYEFEAKLDLGQLLPSMHIREKGEIPLQQPAARQAPTN